MTGNPTITVLSLGGTISSAPSARTGLAGPQLSAADIIASVPGVKEIADVEVVDVARLPSSDIQFEHALVVADRARAAIGSGQLRCRGNAGHRHDRGDGVLPGPARRPRHCVGGYGRDAARRRSPVRTVRPTCSTRCARSPPRRRAGSAALWCSTRRSTPHATSARRIRPRPRRSARRGPGRSAGSPRASRTFASALTRATLSVARRNAGAPARSRVGDDGRRRLVADGAAQLRGTRCRHRRDRRGARAGLAGRRCARARDGDARRPRRRGRAAARC